MKVKSWVKNILEDDENFDRDKSTEKILLDIKSDNVAEFTFLELKFKQKL